MTLRRLCRRCQRGYTRTNGLAFGPDGKMYLTLGSTCNACQERSELSATILQFNLDGTGRRVYASGLRNVYDIAFHPVDGTLFGADNGRDELELNVPEELNLLVDGGNYGWPDCWGDGQGSNCEGTLPPLAEMEQRSSANGLVFYTGSMFPVEYTNDLFIAQWGSHLRDTGRKIVRVKLERDGESYRAEVSDFALGIDRPLDVAQGPGWVSAGRGLRERNDLPDLLGRGSRSMTSETAGPYSVIPIGRVVLSAGEGDEMPIDGVPASIEVFPEYEAGLAGIESNTHSADTGVVTQGGQV